MVSHLFSPFALIPATSAILPFNGKEGDTILEQSVNRFFYKVNRQLHFSSRFSDFHIAILDMV